jgi:hypothetical protein
MAACHFPLREPAAVPAAAAATPAETGMPSQ